MTLAIYKDGACTKALIMDITTYLTTASMPGARKSINAASSRRKNNLKLAFEEDLHTVSN